MNKVEAVGEQVASVEAAICVPAVLFNIARLWKPGMDEDALYDVTHGYWRLGLKREQADYALAVAGGQVRAAFRVLAWRPRRMGDRDWEHDNLDKPRWGFEAEPAPEIRHLIGLDIKALFPQAASNPVRYVNCDDVPTLRVRQLPVAAAPPVDELEQLEGVCQRLQANPVLHVSLHSKELFHSNFLAWLVEAYPDLGEQVLKPWLEGDGTQKMLRVRRETHHLDVVIELPGYRPLVIENKVFSLPYKEQLAGYDGVNLPKAGLTGATRILLSLPDPGWAS